MSRAEQVTVIGAGVIGLTTAVVLAESGLATTIVAAEVPGQTSLAAGAMWGPYLVEPKDKVEQWSRRSLEIFTQLADDPDTGVRITSGIEASRHDDAPPDWATSLPGFRACETGELPSGFTSGFRYAVPLIDMPVYLDYLLRRAIKADLTLETRHLTTLAAPELGPLVVNCAGLGAGHLTGDPDLKPIRGQHLVVSNPGITEFFSEDTGPSEELLCIYPHGDTVVLGGTAITDRGDLAPDDAAAAAILRRCQAVDPRLRDAPILEHRIGARPTRPIVRVDGEQQEERLVLHNYGHGGAGVTLSWGCAEETARLVGEADI